jgi:predicted ATPase
MVWEDLHWVDPSTLELLEQLIEHVSQTRACLLLIYRPEFILPWTLYAPLLQLTLMRFTRPQPVPCLL